MTRQGPIILQRYYDPRAKSYRHRQVRQFYKLQLNGGSRCVPLPRPKPMPPPKLRDRARALAERLFA